MIDKGDKIMYIADSDQWFTNGKIYEVTNLIHFDSDKIFILKDDNHHIHKYGENVVNSNFKTISQLRESKLNLILNIK